MSGLRIGLVTASASRMGGGVFEAVVAHADAIRTLGGEPCVFALRDTHSDEDRARFGSTPVSLSAVIGPRQIGFAPGLDQALENAELDCLHLHGIWMYPSAASSRWARRTGRPYFISPHGMLDRWITARGKWKKALARAMYERTNWRRATTLHALTEREAKDIERECSRTDGVIIPNACPAAWDSGSRSIPPPVVAYIGRIHAKKNLVALVQGWNSAYRPQGARLIIAGWGNEDALGELRNTLAVGDGSAEFVGPVYDSEKADLLQAARFMILPSHSEGLPMAILEAWATGLPTIMTPECNLPEGIKANAALECGYDARNIGLCLEHALALAASEWGAMSAAALALARSEFSSEAVRARWAELYLSPIRGNQSL